ncbi:MAG TPA: tyrosine-type recombinase/integrase, partial [Woeseiaceae bacterium]|nr:tyrosine-type recombinase/integrase [Woeseiaceae bacterium]
IKPGTVSQRVRTIARRAGVTLHSVHQFRHSCASDLLASGASLAEVQRILGHASVSTTVRYLHIADPERHAAVQRHPLNDWLITEAA